MAVSVEGIKTQLEESFPHRTTFPWNKRWGGGAGLTTGLLIRGVPTVVDAITPPAVRDKHLVPALPLPSQTMVPGAARFSKSTSTVLIAITWFPNIATLGMS